MSGGGEVHIRFLGRAAAPDLGRPVVRCRQVHGAAVVEAQVGVEAVGDALVTGRGDIALEVVTADCVPVLLAGATRLGAVHAGWRGLVAGVIPAAAAALGEPVLEAWIGPCIGPCCYEVGEDVARAVEDAAGVEVVRGFSERGRPVIDLAAAALAQLERCEAARISAPASCTLCDAAFFSARRDGPDQGRNRAQIWRE